MIKPRRIGHTTFETKDLDRQIAYWTEVAGLVAAGSVISWAAPVASGAATTLFRMGSATNVNPANSYARHRALLSKDTTRTTVCR